jgi:hypothetical protein
MKYLILLLTLTACASEPKKINYEGSLAELMRAGVPQENDYPEYYHRVGHTCTSQPIYNMNGDYVRTDVRCF